MDKGAEEIGDLLGIRRGAGRFTGCGDGNRDGFAAAVADWVAIRQGAGRNARGTNAGRRYDGVARSRGRRRSDEEKDHGYTRKRPRRALAQGAGPGSISYAFGVSEAEGGRRAGNARFAVTPPPRFVRRPARSGRTGSKASNESKWSAAPLWRSKRSSPSIRAAPCSAPPGATGTKRVSAIGAITIEDRQEHRAEPWRRSASDLHLDSQTR